MAAINPRQKMSPFERDNPEWWENGLMEERLGAIMGIMHPQDAGGMWDRGFEMDQWPGGYNNYDKAGGPEFDMAAGGDMPGDALDALINGAFDREYTGEPPEMGDDSLYNIAGRPPRGSDGPDQEPDGDADDAAALYKRFGKIQDVWPASPYGDSEDMQPASLQALVRAMMGGGEQPAESGPYAGGPRRMGRTQGGQPDEDYGWGDDIPFDEYQ